MSKRDKGWLIENKIKKGKRRQRKTLRGISRIYINGITHTKSAGLALECLSVLELRSLLTTTRIGETNTLAKPPSGKIHLLLALLLIINFALFPQQPIKSSSIVLTHNQHQPIPERLFVAWPSKTPKNVRVRLCTWTRRNAHSRK